MGRKHLFTFASLLALAAVVLGYQGRSSTPKYQEESRQIAAVRAVIEAQVAAWNRGDVTGYMEGYAREDATTLVSGDTVTRGWQVVQDRYKARYDTRAKMGTLAFSELEFKPLSEFYLMAVGRWQLTRAGDEGRRLLPRVALHVAGHVAAVPRRRLRLDDGAHGRDVLVLLRRPRRAAAPLVAEDDRRQRQQRGEGEEVFSAHKGFAAPFGGVVACGGYAGRAASSSVRRAPRATRARLRASRGRTRARRRRLAPRRPASAGADARRSL